MSMLSPVTQPARCDTQPPIHRKSYLCLVTPYVGLGHASVPTVYGSPTALSLYAGLAWGSQWEARASLPF